MVRTAITGWLVAATLLGPWLCCCTAAAPARTPAQPVTPQVTPKRSCCGHKAAAEPTKKPDPRPHRDQCPCKEGVAKVPAVPSAAVPAALPGDALLPAGGSDFPSDCSSIRADRGEGPSLSADVLLHVFHNLRC